jgi:methylmalonyl-CoA/ethylmalonyl-CoA epimerase
MTEPVMVPTSDVTARAMRAVLALLFGPYRERWPPHAGDDELTRPYAANMQQLASFVTAIDHVGIAVPDFDAAVEFHRATFGLELVHEEANEEQGVHEGMLRAPGDPGTGAAVQLLAPLGPASTIAKFLDRRGPGLQQLAYRVTDIESAMAALRATGVRLLYDTPRRGTAGSRINFVHPKDAGGVLVELVEPAPEH